MEYSQNQQAELGKNAQQCYPTKRGVSFMKGVLMESLSMTMIHSFSRS